jgi:hypothetical protein
MDNDAETLYVKLMLRDQEIIRALQIENAQLKEVLNKPKPSKK